MRASPIPRSRRGLPTWTARCLAARPPISASSSPKETEKWGKVIRAANIKTGVRMTAAALFRRKGESPHATAKGHKSEL